VEYVLGTLPGIKRDRLNAYALIVNPKTPAKFFFGVEIFHLFGYRKKKLVKDQTFIFYKTDRKVRVI
jgi:hypothetical protein